MTWLDDIPLTVEIAVTVGVMPAESIALPLEIETSATGNPAIAEGAIEEGWGTDGWFVIADGAYGKIEDGGRIAGDTVTEDQWTDVTPDVRRIDIARRRTSRFQSFDPATLRVELDDGDRDYDPLNLSGPYVVGGVSLCRQGRRVRVCATYDGVCYYLFTGFVTRWPGDLSPFPSTYRTVEATDWFGMLAESSFAAQGATGGGESVTARIRRWLDLYGVPQVEQEIGLSDVLVQSTTLDGSALPAVRTAAASDGGELWVTGEGHIIFEERTALYGSSRVNTNNWTLTNTQTLPTGGTRYEGVPSVSTDPRDTVSRVILTKIGGTTQSATDADLAALYGDRAHVRTDLVNNSDTDVNTLANWLLGWQTDSPFVVEQITVRPDVFASARLLAVAARPFDRVAVEHESPVGGYTVDREGLIVGISHTIDATKPREPTWRCTLQLQDATDLHAFTIQQSEIESQDPIL